MGQREEEVALVDLPARSRPRVAVSGLGCLPQLAWCREAGALSSFSSLTLIEAKLWSPLGGWSASVLVEMKSDPQPNFFGLFVSRRSR